MRDGFWRIDWRSVVLGVEVRWILLRGTAAGWVLRFVLYDVWEPALFDCWRSREGLRWSVDWIIALLEVGWVGSVARLWLLWWWQGGCVLGGAPSAGFVAAGFGRWRGRRVGIDRWIHNWRC